ncbi:hypothetical protein K1I93_09795, partial [Streptococcus australis]|nr:hypothetical protein [Streptococcus australis]
EEIEVKRPEICEGVVQIETAEEKEDGTCDAAPPSSGPEKKEQEPAAETEADPEPEKVPPSPEAPPSPTLPLPSDEPSKPIGDILSSTIPFGIAIALTSIVFLFLKVIHIVVYICIYIYMCGCISMCWYVWIYICVYICVSVYVCVRMFGYIYIYIYMFIYMYLCICMCF